MKRLLGVKQLAKEVLDISPSQIYLMCARREIPHYRLNGSIKFDLAEVTEWLQERHITANDDDDW